MSIERKELAEETLDAIAGGNIQVSFKSNKVRNTSTGMIYDIKPGIDAHMVSDWAYNNYANLGGDDGVIAALQAKEWI